MGREIAVAIARWPALLDHPVRPVVTAVCDVDPTALGWFERIDTVEAKVTDYGGLLARKDVDVVYAAVRHDQDEAIHLDAISAGKDPLAEKPFGIDLRAAERIAAIDARPGAFVRCSSEIPFYPGAQEALRWISDAILQMLAAFFAERAVVLGEHLGCVTLREALLGHRLWAAAMRSSDTGRAEIV